MPYIEPRRNTNGDITSYKIVVSAGYDCTGTQVRHRSIWTPSRQGMTEKQMLKEATAYAFKFEEQINNGYIERYKIRFVGFCVLHWPAVLSRMWRLRAMKPYSRAWWRAAVENVTECLSGKQVAS